MDVPPPPSASAVGSPPTSPAPAPTAAIRNVLVILPSITRGFHPKNYTPPAYANIGRSPSLPTVDMLYAHLKGSQADRLANPRLSIAYGHAASLAPRQPLPGSPLQMRTMEGERQAEDLAGTDGETTPPYPVSSGHLSPAARKEITAQLANPITPNSLPTDARRQSISTLLPAGVMSAKLSQLILEEEEANSRMEQARNSALGTASPPTTFNTPYSMGGGRPETISEGAGEAESAAGTAQPKRRPFPLARSTSNSASVSASPSQLSPLHSTTPSPTTASANAPASRTVRRTRSRPQTSAAALSSAPVPAFGAKSSKANAPATSSSGSGAGSSTTLAGGSKTSEARRPKRAVVSGAPGWEGEEIVNILREDGIQVSTLRAASQLGQFIDHIHSLPMSATSSDATSTGGTPAKAAQIIMVPLSDSPTLPSLSLLLTQGTTPSAICFQQDLLDRARRTEADWLPSALYIIGEAIEQSLARMPFEQFEETTDTSTTPMTYVIAYSANPALSQSVVERCLQAGAIGVLQPPYETRETLALIKKMIASEDATHTARRRAVADATRRASMVSAGSASSPDEVSTLPAQQAKRPIPISPLMPLSQISKPTEKDTAYTPSPSISDLAARRRSVDTGGLSLALQRASRHIMEYERHNGSVRTGDVDASERHGRWRVGPFREARTTNNSPQQSPSCGPSSKAKTDRSASVADVGSHFAPAGDNSSTFPEIEEEEMAVAELLSEMYRQTRVAIEIQMEDYDSFAAPISPEHRERLIRSLAGWDFKPHMLSDEDLFHCACLLFEAVLSIHGLSELGIERDQLHRLLFAIRAIYHAPNPYHNYVHAVDVVQATYTFLVANGVAPPVTYLLSDNAEPWTRHALEESDSEDHENARLALHSLLRPQDILTIMIGAMGHDVGHPGLSNVFMKNAKTPLSQIYSDKSVLENMHCILVVQLLRKHGFGFLLTGANKSTAEPGLAVEFNVASSTDDTSPMSDIFPNIVPASAAHRLFKRNVRPGAVGDWRGFKKLLYATVLSTDMSLHFEWLKRFKDFGKRARAGLCVDLPERAESEARTLLCQALIKCADISNPTRPIEVSEYWSTVLLDEWAVQASLEQKLNLPISVVASADAVIQAKGQIGFIDLFTLPLYEAAADAMPDLRPFADQCAANRALWQARYDTLKELAGDPQPIARTTLNAEQKLPAGTTPEDRYKLLFPLSIPASLLDDDGASASPDIHVQSAGTNSQSDTPSTASTPYSPSCTESTTTTTTTTRSQMPRSAAAAAAANSEIRALRAAYRASINKRHSPHSFHHHRHHHHHQPPPLTTTTSTSSSSSSTPTFRTTTMGTNTKSSFSRDLTQ